MLHACQATSCEQQDNGHWTIMLKDLCETGDGAADVIHVIGAEFLVVSQGVCRVPYMPANKVGADECTRRPKQRYSS